jgi:hypothetical protein
MKIYFWMYNSEVQVRKNWTIVGKTNIKVLLKIEPHELCYVMLLDWHLEISFISCLKLRFSFRIYHFKFGIKV